MSDEFTFYADAQAIGHDWEDRLLEGLNPPQREAVLHDEGPLLILAGAGSGKTRVITHRIAYLVQVRGISPRRILAITFTNKAAREMQTRVEDLLGEGQSQGMWIGTFHSMMARVLRRFADQLGFTRNFSIADTGAQQAAIKGVIQSLDLDQKTFDPRSVHNQISSAKNRLIGPDEYKVQAQGEYWKEKVALIYKGYQDMLRQNNLMDFDDLLYYAVLLFKQNKEILQIYQSRFQYIMVDEYQDTNQAQYELVRLLSLEHGNLCVVGDDDQSIYSFRGADIQNILDFEKDFKRAKIIKLEQNYRSTGNILEAANRVIGNNQSRKAKKLWTDQGEGEKIIRLNASSEQEEALFIANEIKRQVGGGKASYDDFAILYRINALSRNLEFALQRNGIPFKIYGGLRFFDRKEIKDTMAYLYLITSPRDNVSFRRAVQTPRRGIGEATLDELERLATMAGTSIMDICIHIQDYPSLSRTQNKIREFVALIARMQKTLLADQMSLAEYIEYVQDESGLMQDIIDQQDKGKEDAISRLENMKELLSEAVTFQESGDMTEEWDFTVDELGDLAGERDIRAESLAGGDLPEALIDTLLRFLDQAALQSDLDKEDEEEEDKHVSLLTIHSAKGLEFNQVFVVGMEEGIFPGYRSIADPSQLEEERRLAYVAITRARKKLYLSTSSTRLLFGRTERYIPSRFLEELPDHTYNEIGSRFGGDDYGFGSDSRSRSTYERPGQQLKDLRQDRQRFASGTGGRTIPDHTESKPKVKIETPGAGALQADQLHKGDRVRHFKYGLGTIKSVEPVAGDALLLIHFDKAGDKRMLANMAKLGPA